jgi:hypothetical protein
MHKVKLSFVVQERALSLLNLSSSNTFGLFVG